MRLEDLRPNVSVRGTLPGCASTIIRGPRFGSKVPELSKPNSSPHAEDDHGSR